MTTIVTIVVVLPDGITDEHEKAVVDAASEELVALGYRRHQINADQFETDLA